MNISTVSEAQAHIVPLTVLLRDLDVLLSVCRQHGWEFRSGASRYRCPGRWLADPHAPNDLGRCQHAITIPGCRSEIGLVQQGNHFAPVWDDSATGGLLLALGPGLQLLWRGYIVETVRRSADQRGHTVSKPPQARGTVRVRIAEPHSQRSAHVRISADADTTLWTFGPGAWETFHYLALALGPISIPPDKEDCP